MTIRTRTLATVLALASLGASGTASAAPANGVVAFVATHGDDEFADTAAGIGAVNPDGTGRRLLTRSTPGVGEPAWSPDGRLVALTFGASIALVHPDGSGLRTLRRPAGAVDHSPAWSSRGELAFLRTEDDGASVRLMLVNAGGRGQTTLLGGVKLAGTPVWSRDGRQVSVLEAPGARWARVVDVATGRYRFRRLPARCTTVPIPSPRGPETVCIDGRARRAVLVLLGPQRSRELASGVGLGTPTWSPDATRLAYVLDIEDVTVLELATGRSRIYKLRARSNGHLDDAPQPSWAPDSRHFVTGTINSGWLVAIVDRRTGLRRPLVQHTRDSSPRWSPDGTQLAYVRRTGIGGSELRVQPLSGQGRKVADHVFDLLGEWAYAWSPDSRTLAVVSTTGTLSTVAADGSGTRVLARDACCTPAWSPDGTAIAFTTRAGTIALVAADGSATTLAGPPGAACAPQWSPDGARLFYVAPRSTTDVSTGYARGTASQWTFSSGRTSQLDPSTDVVRGSYAPDGSAFFVTSFVSPSSAVFQGTVIDPAVSRPAIDGAGYGTWSPDGAMVAYEDAGGVELAPLPQPGAPWQPSARLANASDPSWQRVP